MADKEVAALPLLDGTPGEAEYMLVGNAEGGEGIYHYARRRFRKPLIGVVGGGTVKDPIAGQKLFQHDDLIGLGATNFGRIKIEVDNVIKTNFGKNIGFTFDNVTGIITNNNNWVSGSGLYIDLNQ